MAQHALLPHGWLATVNQAAQRLSLVKQNLSLHQAKLVINSFFTTLLIAIGLRIMLALLLFDGKILDALMAITFPFVAPFSNNLLTGNQMLQTPAILAFISYYFIFRIIATYVNRLSTKLD
jgi:hypothetical protein